MRGRNHRLFHYILLCHLLTLGDLRAQPQLVQFERITAEQGVSTGSVNCIIRDSYGFLWLGTSNGLLRYDGYSFKTFEYDPTDTTSISGNHVWTVCEDRNGDLWIGTSGRGLCWYVRDEDRFLRYRHVPNEPTSLGGDAEVPWVYRDRADNIWIALWEFGLDRYDRAAGRFLHHRIPIKDQEGVPRESVHRIYEDRTGTLWIGTKRGLVQFDSDYKDFHVYQHDPNDPHSLGGNYVYAILEDRKGTLWVGSADGGVSRYDRQADHFQVYRHDPRNPKSLSSDAVSAVSLDSLGFLWIGTHDLGLNRFDPATGTVTRFVSSPGNPTSISSNQITSLYVDRTGVLWIGTSSQGLNRYHPYKRKFVHYHHEAGNPGSLSGNIVDAIHETGEGEVWVGTSGKGLNRYDPITGKVSQYRHDPDFAHSLSSDYVSALAEDSRGYLWIGTYDGGLNRLHLKSGMVQRVAGESEDLNEINELLIDQSDRLWIGTDGYGLSVYDTQQEVFVYSGSDPTSPFFDKRHVFALYEDSQRHIWIGVWGEGMCRYDPTTGRVTNYHNEPDDSSSISSNIVISITEDSAGNIWFGTWGEGLNCLLRDSRRFTRYTSADGLPNDNIYGILADQQGGIWVSTSNGLARYDPQNDVWKAYDRNDGLQSQEFRQGAYHKGPSGRFYFGGVNGFNAFWPEKVVDNPNVPSVVLTSFSIHDRPVPSQRLGAALEDVKQLTLSHRENYLSFEFAALDFTLPQKNQYAYKLERFDDEWIYSGNRRYASYTNLDPGDYIFKVRGSNNDRVWNRQGTSVAITITPPFWQTWWAYGLYACLIAATLASIRRYELNKRQRLEQERLRREREQAQLREATLRSEAAEFRAKALEAEKEIEKQQIRNRIARDLHDEIGSNLSSITLLSEFIQDRSELSDELRRNLRNIHNIGRLSTQAIRDIVWFVNPASDTLRDLLTRMNETTSSMLNGIPFEFEKPEIPSDYRLGPETKRNVYLIFKETVNNIIKHAAATHVRISLRERDGYLTLCVEDNGIGFDAARVKEGNGLRNLRHRAAEIAADLSIDSRKNEGTRVSLKTKFPKNGANA